jgi:hypothetical protein
VTDLFVMLLDRSAIVAALTAFARGVVDRVVNEIDARDAGDELAAVRAPVRLRNVRAAHWRLAFLAALV